MIPDLGTFCPVMFHGASEDPLLMIHREESLHKTLCPRVRRKIGPPPAQVHLLLGSNPLAYFSLSEVPPADAVLLPC